MAIRSVERERCALTWALSGTTVASANVPATSHGWIQYMSYVMPSTSADVSGTASFKDNTTGKTYYTGTTSNMKNAASGGLTAQNIPMLGGETSVVVTLDAIPGCAAGASAVPLSGSVDLYFVV